MNHELNAHIEVNGLKSESVREEYTLSMSSCMCKMVASGATLFLHVFSTPHGSVFSREDVLF